MCEPSCAATAAEPSCASTAAPSKKQGKREGKRGAIVSSAMLRQLPNEAFTQYYKEQLHLGDEWDEFEACLRSPLPVTWRFSGHGAAAQALCASMAQHILPALEEQPTPLPWYPGRLAWRTGVSRAALRGKDWEEQSREQGGGGRSEAVAALHGWLLSEAELGRVQRQEAVSMVPPLLLDVRLGHCVLDMCASPGSKTQQLLEALVGGDGGDGDGGGGGGGGGGLVVANDDQIKRCHMLASRASRLNSPSLVVTNHDARLLPEWLGPSGAPGTPGAGPGADAGGAGARTPLRFDRVLADVPCSGDGTPRTNPATLLL